MKDEGRGRRYSTPMKRKKREHQAIIEKKAKKVIWPILGLGMLSAVLLLIVMGVWLLRSISSQG